MVSPPTANPNTRSRSASSKASTTKSASSRDEPTDCATTNISASKCSPACCRRYDPPKSPTRFPEDPEIETMAVITTCDVFTRDAMTRPLFEPLSEQHERPDEWSGPLGFVLAGM